MTVPPTVKYTLGRVGLFVVIFGAMLLIPGLDFFLKVMIAILASFGLQFVLLKKWRTEMIGYIDSSVARSKAEKAKLRAALAGEDEPEKPGKAADAGKEADGRAADAGKAGRAADAGKAGRAADAGKAGKE